MRHHLTHYVLHAAPLRRRVTDGRICHTWGYKITSNTAGTRSFTRPPTHTKKKKNEPSSLITAAAGTHTWYAATRVYRCPAHPAIRATVIFRDYLCSRLGSELATRAVGSTRYLIFVAVLDSKHVYFGEACRRRHRESYSTR